MPPMPPGSDGDAMMFTRTIRSLAALSIAFAAAPSLAAESVPVPCERACMEDLAEQLLAAMVAHDASGLPLAKDARYTEIGQDMGFANGLWRTASKVGAYRHVFADPASGQFGIFATLDENG